MNLPTGIKTRKTMKAKFSGGTCPRCTGRIFKGQGIIVDTDFAGTKTTVHDTFACNLAK